MKKTLLPILLCSFFFADSSIAQNCRILRDSITLGENISEFKDYVYNVNGLIAVYTTDSGQTTSSRFDTAFYDNNSRLVKIENAYYYLGIRYVMNTQTYTYNGNNQVSRIASAGTNQGGSYTRAHDFFYDGSGNITAMTIDTLAETGTPEGFPGSFGNIVWSGGNIATMNLVVGTDVIEIIVSHDNAINVIPKRFPDGATDVVISKMVNNLTKLVFANNETMGPAGSIALDVSYTYTNSNDVFTEHSHPSLFESSESRIQYGYECFSGQSEFEQSAGNFFPNPADNIFHIDLNTSEIFDVTLFDITGKVVQRIEKNKNSLMMNLENLRLGIYFVHISTPSASLTQKIVKQ